MRDPLVYIVIVNYQQWQDSCECLASICSSTFSNYAIILVDNNSPNDSVIQLVDWAVKNNIDHQTYTRKEFDDQFDPARHPLLMIVKNDTNHGFASGNNLALGLIARTTAYAWLLNPDMIASPTALEELVNYSENQDATAIIGTTIRSAGENQDILIYGGARVNFWFARVRPVKTTKGIESLDYISGTSLFTKASNFKTFGLLPEDYFLYWEETDWCYRAREKGALLKVCTEAVCFDKGSTSIGKGFLAHYYYCRNGLLFISKYKKAHLGVALVSMGFRFMKRVVTGQWAIAKGVFRGTGDFLKKRFHAIQ